MMDITTRLRFLSAEISGDRYKLVDEAAETITALRTQLAHSQADLDRYKRHYINACNGRKAFRNSYREERNKVAKAESEKAELVKKSADCADALEVAFNYCPNDESFDYIGDILADIKALLPKE